MANYENLIIDTDSLTPGKFYKVYTDSNATTLLIPKDEDDDIKSTIANLEERLGLLESSGDSPMSISNSPNAVINIINEDSSKKYKRIELNEITDISIPYDGIISSVKVYGEIQSNISGKKMYEQIDDGVQIFYTEDILTKQKQLLINSNNPIKGYAEIFIF